MLALVEKQDLNFMDVHHNLKRFGFAALLPQQAIWFTMQHRFVSGRSIWSMQGYST